MVKMLMEYPGTAELLSYKQVFLIEQKRITWEIKLILSLLECEKVASKSNKVEKLLQKCHHHI